MQCPDRVVVINGDPVAEVSTLLALGQGDRILSNQQTYGMSEVPGRAEEIKSLPTGGVICYPLRRAGDARLVCSTRPYSRGDHLMNASPAEATEERTGGCLCGRIRFTATGPAVYPHTCHCDHCQKLGGAPVMWWAGFGRVTWTGEGGEPTWFETFPGKAKRGFCPTCVMQADSVSNALVSHAQHGIPGERRTIWGHQPGGHSCVSTNSIQGVCGSGVEGSSATPSPRGGSTPAWRAKGDGASESLRAPSCTRYRRGP